MDETTRIFLTRGLQIAMWIPVILAARQLYRDVYDNQPNTCQDSKPDQIIKQGGPHRDLLD